MRFPLNKLVLKQKKIKFSFYFCLFTANQNRKNVMVLIETTNSQALLNKCLRQETRFILINNSKLYIRNIITSAMKMLKIIS